MKISFFGDTVLDRVYKVNLNIDRYVLIMEGSQSHVLGEPWQKFLQVILWSRNRILCYRGIVLEQIPIRLCSLWPITHLLGTLWEKEGVFTGTYWILLGRKKDRFRTYSRVGQGNLI